jgi:hypothetical protein
VSEGRWCATASNRQDTTVWDVWDFGAGSEGLLKDTPSDEDRRDLDEEEDEETCKIKKLIEAYGDSHGV